MPKRKQQLQNSPQLEQLLNALPTLAFEPELVDLSMDKARLMELMKNDQTEPDMLMDLLSEEFVSELDQRLAMLEAVTFREIYKVCFGKSNTTSARRKQQNSSHF